MCVAILLNFDYPHKRSYSSNFNTEFLHFIVLFVLDYYTTYNKKKNFINKKILMKENFTNKKSINKKEF